MLFEAMLGAYLLEAIFYMKSSRLVEGNTLLISATIWPDP
jgi:hypothetical protein